MKKIYVTEPTLPPIEDYIEMIKVIWEDRWITNMGKLHHNLEENLKKYLLVEELSLFVNGHMALEMVLQAMDLKGEVITTPFTFISTTHAIVREKLTPIFCDINPEDYNIDASKIEELITDKTTAIVPVHTYGNLCDVEKISQIAKKYNLKVIYDAAHAFGVEYNNEGVGNFGDASVFSFHATKVFNTIEGGAVCYHDKKIGEILYGLKNFGIRSPIDIDSIGANAKMNEFQAAMGLCNLSYIDLNIKKRKDLTECYDKDLSNIEGITISKRKENTKSNYAYYPVIFDETKLGFSRDLVYEKLMDKNIFSRKYFYPLTNNVSCYKEKYNAYKTPIADKISKSILTLPLSTALEVEDIKRITKIITDLL